MKKLLTLLTLGVMAIPSTYAQSQRIVLLEHFTQASCGPCATYNPRIKDLVNANEDKIIAIKYQTSWPGLDPMNAHNPTQVATRVSYYGVTGVPHSVLDGNYYNGHPQNWDLAKVETRRAVESPFDITIASNLNNTGDSVFVSMNIKATKVLTTTDLKAHIAIVERRIAFSKPPGSNGETEFEHVMKSMLPTDQGSSLAGSWTVGKDTTINVSWKLANIYQLPQLGVVAFVQNKTTKEVYQAAYQKTKIPFEINVDGNSTSAKSSISSDLTQTVSTTFTTSDTVSTNYEFNMTNTLPTLWTAKFTIDGVDYLDKATIAADSKNPKEVSVTFTMPPGAKDQKAKSTLTINNSTRLSAYKVTANFTAFSPVTTLYVNTDANTSSSKMTTALKTNNREYLVATGDEFEGLANTSVTKTSVKYLWVNTGALLGGTMSEATANNVISYIENGGKLLLTSPMLGYDAYYGTKAAALQDLWTNYLAQGPFSFSDVATELEKDGRSINAIAKELVLHPLVPTPGSIPATTNASYGTNLYAGEGQTLILNYDEDADMGAAIRYEDATTGSKYVFSSIRFDLIKETAFRNTMIERIYKYFDGEALGVNSLSVSNNGISLSPNPATIESKIAFEKALTSNSEVKLFNAIGQEVYSNNISVGTKTFTVNTSNLTAGLYTVKVLENGKTLSTSKLNVAK